ncbi:hypothetical protein [Shewanella gelidii]|uniref:Uncharacterized protein n=1 Tax=Shewanella gelidii TaxID=1642821 RepID=A0A917N7E1_9GAMM|nr:hypothetical protein [Shewanella gelidii]MCL1097000.1 hypothetical protein [Shewanella gelidii]GGI71834.1 hypothetical protein GCM10009332_06480 [Shewanella gelidii]
MENRYKEAIYRLEDKLMAEPKCVESLNEWICSYHALADIYQQQGEEKRAMKCLLIPHQSMLFMATHDQGDEDKRLIAYSALKFTLPPIMAFAEEHPLCEGCMQVLQQQLEAIEAESNIFH